VALSPVEYFSQFLRLSFFRSPNYVAGVSGWTINQDGSAEFNNGTFRGVVVDAGMFVYNGTPAAGNPPIFSITNPGTSTDPFGNAVVANGVATYNAFGAVINLLSMAKSAFFQYRDLGSAVQGALILAVASTASTDPVTGAGYAAALNGIDAVFGTVIRVVGAGITLSSAPFTQDAFIGVQNGSGAVNPAVFLRAPEQTKTGHLVMVMQGTSPDGTQPGQLVIASEPTGTVLPTPVSQALFEVQGTTDFRATGGAVLRVTELGGAPASPPSQIISKTAGDRAFGTEVTGDANFRFRIDSNGRHDWGPGPTATDLSELRLAAGIKQLNGALALADQAAPAQQAANSVLFSTAGTPQVIRPSSLTGAVPATQTDITSRTVTQAVTTQLSGSFTIPANDANVGTQYRLKCSGFATWGATQQLLTLAELLGGTNINQVNFAAAAFAASTPLDYDAEFTLTVVTTGAGGTARALLRAVFNINNAAVLTTNSATGVRQGGGIAFNTTIARALQLNALWAATVGAPTITCDRTTFERIGP
jgi:hypothetical protein